MHGKYLGMYELDRSLFSQHVVSWDVPEVSSSVCLSSDPDSYPVGGAHRCAGSMQSLRSEKKISEPEIPADSTTIHELSGKFPEELHILSG